MSILHVYDCYISRVQTFFENLLILRYLCSQLNTQLICCDQSEIAIIFLHKYTGYYSSPTLELVLKTILYKRMWEDGEIVDGNKFNLRVHFQYIFILSQWRAMEFALNIPYKKTVKL